MAKLMKADGTVEAVTPANGKKFTLEELQGFVGGYIELLPLRGRRVLCNEDGLVRGLRPNYLASIACGMTLVGNVVELEKGEKF